MHQPVLVLRVDRYVRRAVAIGEGGGDLAAQEFRVELERLVALPTEAEAGDDFHGGSSSDG